MLFDNKGCDFVEAWLEENYKIYRVKTFGSLENLDIGTKGKLFVNKQVKDGIIQRIKYGGSISGIYQNTVYYYVDIRVNILEVED